MSLIYKTTCLAAKGVFGVVGQWQVKGLENLPKEGGLIIASNHRSNYDPPILACSLTRPVNFMAKEELFNNFFLRKYLQGLNAFPVKRGAGDTSAIRKALKILKNGEILGLFPEGNRNPSNKLKKAKLGTVMLAIKSKVPILPVGLSGTEKPFSKDLIINVGKAFTLNEYYDRKLEKEEMKLAGERIMSKIADLIK